MKIARSVKQNAAVPRGRVQLRTSQLRGATCERGRPGLFFCAEIARHEEIESTLWAIFAQKNTTKKLIFLCFFTDVNSSQNEINVPFLCKKASHFDPCIYKPFLFLHLFTVFEKLVFYVYHM